MKKKKRKDGKKRSKKRSQEEIKQKLLKQFEFYFSDSNVRKDKFIQELMAKYNGDGFIPLAIISSFNRVQQLTKDTAVIQDALGRSELLELSQDQMGLRRRFPVPDHDDSDDRTIFVKEIPLATDHDKMINYFSPYGKVMLVSLPRNEDRSFKGFAFVEFSRTEEAERACAEEFALKVCTKMEWLAQKRQKRKEALIQKGASEKGPGGPFVSGTVVEISGIPENNVKSSTLLELFNKLAQVCFVDYRGGETRGYIRFMQPEDRAKVIEAVQKESLVLEGSLLQVAALEPHGEARYWHRVRQHVEARCLPPALRAQHEKASAALLKQQQETSGTDHKSKAGGKVLRLLPDTDSQAEGQAVQDNADPEVSGEGVSQPHDSGVDNTHEALEAPTNRPLHQGKKPPFTEFCNKHVRWYDSESDGERTAEHSSTETPTTLRKSKTPEKAKAQGSKRKRKRTVSPSKEGETNSKHIEQDEVGKRDDKESIRDFSTNGVGCCDSNNELEKEANAQNESCARAIQTTSKQSQKTEKASTSNHKRKLKQKKSPIKEKTNSRKRIKQDDDGKDVKESMKEFYTKKVKWYDSDSDLEC